MVINTEQEYNEAKERLEKGEKMIEAEGGFLNAPPKWVKGFQVIAEACLIYETENNLLPI